MTDRGQGTEGGRQKAEGGRVEGWKGGRVEEWKSGRVEGWKGGRVEGWKDGRVEGWKGGRVWAITRSSSGRLSDLAGQFLF